MHKKLLKAVKLLFVFVKCKCLNITYIYYTLDPAAAQRADLADLTGLGTACATVDGKQFAK